MPDAIGAIEASPLHGSVDSAMNALGGMDSEGFLQLLVAQLQYQSPLEPKDPGDLMIQTATLAQLDASQQLLATQQRDIGLQEAVMATGMIGSEVTGTDADGQLLVGEVDAVRYTDAGPALQVGDGELLLRDVTELRRMVTVTTDATEVP